MGFLVDTCVVSELYKPAPDLNVRHTINSQRTEDLYISVISLAEIRRGIMLLPAGRRRRDLEEWAAITEDWYGDRMLEIDRRIARTWAERVASARLRGWQVSMMDGLIAATAICHDLTVLTRNVADFEPTGVSVVNPWLPPLY